MFKSNETRREFAGFVFFFYNSFTVSKLFYIQYNIYVYKTIKKLYDALLSCCQNTKVANSLMKTIMNIKCAFSMYCEKDQEI